MSSFSILKPREALNSPNLIPDVASLTTSVMVSPSPFPRALFVIEISTEISTEAVDNVGSDEL